jgi:hypothetical protein
VRLAVPGSLNHRQLDAPVRYLDLTFHCEPTTNSPPTASLRQLLTVVNLPALHEVSPHVTDRPTSFTRPQHVYSQNDIHHPYVIQDFGVLMDMVNSRGSTSTPPRITLLCIKIDACCEHIIPSFLRQESNIALRGLEVDLSRPPRGAQNTRSSLLRHLTYSHKTLTDLVITEHDSFHTDQNPRADFSPFSALCRLRVPASIWFDTQIKYNQGLVSRRINARPFVTTHLPHSLQSLQVDFNGANGFLVVDSGWQQLVSSYRPGWQVRWRPVYQ